VKNVRGRCQQASTFKAECPPRISTLPGTLTTDPPDTHSVPDLTHLRGRRTQDEEDTRSTSFHKARRLVRWHYQWLVLNEFLPKLIDPAVLGDIRTNGRRFYKFEAPPFKGRLYMPLEFSVARTGSGTR
jgi:hypothetical protein